MNNYIKTILNKTIDITHIITIHYFEYSKDFYFKGESHDFWEFLYVDKGQITVTTDNRTHNLHAGEMIFHKPNEFHNVVANGIVAPNLIVVSFECLSETMEYFNDLVIQISNPIKNTLVKIINESYATYSSDLSDPLLSELILKEKTPIGSEQVIKNHLETMLIEIIREKDDKKVLHTSLKENLQTARLENIHCFMIDNIGRKLSIEDISYETKLSVSMIQKLYKEALGVTPLQYFRKLKIEYSKVLIREERINFTEIANLLGYNSLHYFSRSFKKATGMNLSEYALSVKVKII